MKHRLRRLLALALSLAILLSMGSAGAWAAETEDELTEAEDWLTSEEAFNESDDSSLAVDELPTEDSFMEEEVVEESVTEEAMMAPADEHKHDGITFEEWTETDRLPDTPGSYCLTGDVTISGTWNVPGGTTNLCLNGHGIRKTGNSSSVISVTSGRTLNLYDCGSTVQHSFTVPNPAPNGAGMAVVDAERTEGHEIFSGGYITGGCEVSEGGGLNIRGGVVNMYGGNIIGNSTNDGSGTTNGGAVFMDNSAMFTMYGGAIQYNFGRNGASLFVEDGSTFVLEGGSVSYGKGGRGGIFSRGTVKIHGGEVLNHYCTIWQSGGFNGWDGTLEITGGTISGNTGVNARLAGIMPASLTLGGNPLISDNLDKNGNQANLYLNDGRVITIASKLSSSVKSNRIGVSMNSGTGVFTSGWSSIMGEADPAEYFFSENSDAIIILLNGEATLVPENYRLIHLLPGENSGEEIAVASESGTEYTLPASPFTSPEGKAFAGWSDGENVYQVGDSYSITQEVTFTAQWAPGTTLTYELADSYGDGWNGAAIQVTDKASGAELVSLSIGNGGSASGSFDVLAGRTIVFSWKPGSYDNECSYTVWDAEGNVVFSGSSSMTPPIEYTYYAPVATVTSGGTSTDYADFAAAVSAWNSAESGATLTLLADVTTASTINVSGTKTLDLNGHGIRMTSTRTTLFYVSGNLTLNDSNPTATHRFNPPSGTAGLATLNEESGALVIQGGYITGFKGQINGTYAIQVPESGTFTMNGGNLIGNEGGSTSSAQSMALKSNGHVVINGGAIIYNHSEFRGSAVNGQNLEMNGGEISHNTCGQTGAVHVHNLVMTGGVITENQNKSENNIAGICVYNSARFSGNPVITGNIDGSGNSRNLYLESGAKGNCSITGTLGNDANIGIHMSGNTGVITNSTDTSLNDASKFSSDNSSYMVGQNAGGQLLLGTPVTVTYKVVNGTWSDDDTADKTETVASGANPASVPTGMKASEGYTGGAWDTDPAEATITGATTFTYTFEAKTPASVTKAPEAKTLTYDGSAQKLVSAGTAEGGSMRYALGTNATTAPTEGWDTSIPTGTNAGSYYVWYKVVGDANHNDVAPEKVSVSIGKVDATITVKDQTIKEGESVAEGTGNVEVSGLLTGHSLDTISLESGTGETAGKVIASDARIKDGNNQDVTSNYTVVYTPGTLTVRAALSRTVTFKVVNGSWNEGDGDAATADKTVTLAGYEGDTLKLAANQIPAVGTKPNDTYKAGSWNVTPSANTAITADTTYIYTYAQKNAISRTVTFKVVNGSWNEGDGDAATADKTVTLTGYEGDTLKLDAAQIPAVGDKPGTNYKAGSWDVTPSANTAITADTTYTYTYAQKDTISRTVTFKVVNGSWNEGDGDAATADKTVTLTGYEGDTLKLTAAQVPAVGDKPGTNYKAGSWDVTPSADTEITANTTYTYTYAQKDAISRTVTFKVVNGSWNEGDGDAATADKTVTLAGYEGDTLKLAANQIPAVGTKPNDTYKAGSWNVTPSADTEITADTTYIYTYAQKNAISRTVTFKVVNGSWNEGDGDAATADKTVTLTGYEGDTLKLAANQIPAVGDKPGTNYKAGIWNVTPSADTAITADTTYTYTYAQKDTISHTVTFKVVNGSWNDETATDKTVTLTGYEGDTLKLAATDIPAVGSKPNDTYKAGSWDTTPSAGTKITEATTYTYTYAQKDSISRTVTFKVVNGSWNDETTTDKTVTLTGYEGDTLKLTAAQIPAVGSKPNDTYKAGSWDVTPNTTAAITEATTYTYTYAQKDSISQTVTFKVVNGKWDDDSTADKTVTLTGYEGDTLKLAANQIPAVGTKPNDAYKGGSWDVTPSAEIAITGATTYTYTYSQKNSISQTVTFKVVNGKWDDETTADKSVTLTGYEGDTLKLAATDIPAVGTKPNDTYKAGSWDTTPSADTAITAATTYTYTYAAKEASVVTKAPTAKTLTYTGSAQALVTAGEATGGTMHYAIGTATEATGTYGTSIPTATNAGTYIVWYKVIGDTNHTDTDPASVSVTIGKKEVGLSWSDTSFTYDGQSHQPSAAASGLVAGDTCTVTVTGEQTDAGTYTATASALSNGSYKLPDSPTTSFTIEKAEPGTPRVTMQGYTYGGTLPIPAIGDYTGGGAVTWYYSTSNSNSGGTAWTDSMTATSLYAGTYYMYAVIAPTENYLGYTTQTSRFEITPGVVTVSGSINFGNYSGNLTLSLLSSDGKETVASDSISVSGGKGTYHFEHITQGQYILRASWSEGGAENVLNDELEIR